MILHDKYGLMYSTQYMFIAEIVSRVHIFVLWILILNGVIIYIWMFVLIGVWEYNLLKILLSYHVVYCLVVFHLW